MLPEYVQVQLSGYPQGLAAQLPVIAVYPVGDYSLLNPEAARALDNLKQFLAQDPLPSGQIPFLPVQQDVQSFHSNVQRLDFANGSGVRFLALYAQYPAPVTNAEIFYTFQGLTSDGRNVVSVILPVDHSTLPASPDALSIDRLQEIAQNYDAYRSEMAAALEAQPDSSFSPDLSQLDALVQTLSVER